MIANTSHLNSISKVEPKPRDIGGGQAKRREFGKKKVVVYRVESLRDVKENHTNKLFSI